MFPLCTLDYVVIPVFTRIVLNMSIVSVLLKLFKCCKRQPTIIFVVLCDYKLVSSNVTRRWIFDFFEFFFPEKNVFFSEIFFFPPGLRRFLDLIFVIHTNITPTALIDIQIFYEILHLKVE